MIVDNRSTAGGVGPVGPIGPKGDQGIPGNNGTNGTDGADGATGPGGLSAIDGTSPTFTYNLDGTLSRIDYVETSYKLFTYTSGKLTQIDFHEVGVFPIKRKTLNYTLGVLTSIDEEIV